MIIKTEQDTIKSYLEDASKSFIGKADGVYIPENLEDIIKIFYDASQNKTPVTISGNGTGTTGGRIPESGIILSTEKLKEIKNISKKEKSVIVQAGVLLDELKFALWEQDLFLPPNPTEQTASIGACIANNSSGSRSFKFGAVRDYVQEIKVVLSSGYVLEIPRNTYIADKQGYFHLPDLSKIKIPEYTMPKTKNASGLYTKPGMDLIDLFIGSEGILGFIYEAKLKLMSRPEKIMASFIFFKEEKKAVEFVFKIKEKTKQVKKQKDIGDINPMSLEYMDNNSLNILKNEFPNIPEHAKAVVFFEQDYKEENEEILLLAWQDIFTQNKIDLNDTWFADTMRDILFFQEFRHTLPERLNEIESKHGYRKIGTDTAVPEKHFIKMLDYYNTKLTQANLIHAIFGHIGDNHLHVNILPQNDTEFENAKKLYDNFMTKTIEFNGTISAEHGIGKLKKKYLRQMLGDNSINEIINIKKIFDPKLILNLNNMIDIE